MMKPETFVDWLRAKLRRREIEQSELARSIKVNPALVSRWPAGLRPTPESLQRIPGEFGVGFDYLLSVDAG